jgi:hypothetical protein
MTQKKAKQKRKSAASNSSQSAKFVAKAKEIGADENPEAFERAFRKIVPERKPAK